MSSGRKASFDAAYSGKKACNNERMLLRGIAGGGGSRRTRVLLHFHVLYATKRVAKSPGIGCDGSDCSRSLDLISWTYSRKLKDAFE